MKPLLKIVRLSLCRDVHPIVAFMLAEKSELLLREVSEMVAHYLVDKQAKDQAFLVMYESKRADLLYCQLLSPDFTPSLKRSLLRLLTVLLRTNRVSLRHKFRMQLAESRYLGLLHLWFLQAAKSKQPVSKEEILMLADQMMLFDHATSYQGILGLAHHLCLADTSTKLEIARRIMTWLFARPEMPQHFAKQIGWQESVARLLVKRLLNPDGSDAFIDDAIIVEDSATMGQQNPHSPTHLIEAATSAAKQYLPQPAGDAVELIGHTVGAVVSGGVASSVAHFAGERVQATHDAVSARTQQILGTVQSGLDSISERAAATVRGATRSRRQSQGSSLDGDQPLQTPRFLHAYDQFGFEDLGGAVISQSSSSDDVSRVAETPTRTHGATGAAIQEEEECPDIEVVSADLASEASRSLMTGGAPSAGDNEEEELCQLVINILFTIMWRGMQGTSEEIIKERGACIACINMLGLNNELYRSHVELKRQLVEQCVQAVLSDHREITSHAASQAAEGPSPAEHVMQWVFDLIVLDQSKSFKKKVTETLLDGILALVEKLNAFGRGGGDDSLTKMAVEVLLKVADQAEEVSIRSMATAKIHALIQTRTTASAAENAYLLAHLVKGVKRGVAEYADDESFSFLAPVIKALLENSRESLRVGSQLPSLDLRKQTPAFFAAFKDYLASEEWRYFEEKKLNPLMKDYLSGSLTDLPREMDIFWAECYELSQVATHKRSREVGESKLKFQAKYAEPFHQAVKVENVRLQNGLSQQKSHTAFIKRRWDVSKRLFFGPRGAWYDPETTVSLEYWKLSPNETTHRMRLKLVPNACFDSHAEASAARDNVKSRTEQKSPLLQLQISKDALTSQEEHAEDCLTEDDLRSIAKEQVNNLSPGHSGQTQKVSPKRERELSTPLSANQSARECVG